MDKLLPEFQKVVDDTESYYLPAANVNVNDAIKFAVSRCQELALRRPEMSDAEILAAWRVAFPKGWMSTDGSLAIRAVLDAYEAKRFAPEAVGVTLYRSARGAVVPAISPHDLPIGDWTPISKLVEIKVEP